MLRYYAKKSFNEDPQRVADAPFERAWVYGTEVTDAELATVGEQYQLDTGILKDVKDKNELPRVEYSEGDLYIFIRAPRETAKGGVTVAPFLSVIKGTLLITLSNNGYTTPEELFESVKVDMKSTKHVFLQLVNHVIGLYEASIHATGGYIQSTGQRLRTHEVDNKDFIKFVTVEHDLNEYHTNLTALQAVLGRLRENRHAIFSQKDCEFIEDMILHISQLSVAAVLSIFGVSLLGVKLLSIILGLITAFCMILLLR
ncbi:hypothetical protein B7Z17_04820, partial [Candidatus Saccharibacteria bacterium 32-49-10]